MSAEQALMYNEMQAYLMFTREPLFFRPKMVGMTRAVEPSCRCISSTGMPPGWLRDVLASYQDGVPAQ